jgi:hypothetical protein
VEVVHGDVAQGDCFLEVRFADGTTEFVDADGVEPLPA